ncbi:hypothetical protein BEH84_00468 [Eisenbergiella tayi]|uniref:Uncharacterized protein n=1 Tax=Eisenbergiella tayi TaxID=1432052 RepID=A0A1E3AVL0_9FIRM|nr:hypothetical protein BEH84_00468 [Eisenbergiella tayi]
MGRGDGVGVFLVFFHRGLLSYFGFWVLGLMVL